MLIEWNLHVLVKKEKTKVNIWGEGYVNPVVGILSQGMCISNYHDVHSKCITILFINYISIKLKEN